MNPLIAALLLTASTSSATPLVTTAPATSLTRDAAPSVTTGATVAAATASPASLNLVAAHPVTTAATIAAASTPPSSSLSLDAALALAAEHSPALARSAANTAGAQARAGAAFAPLLPQVSMSLGAKKSVAGAKGGVPSTDPSAIGGAGADAFGAGVSVHQLLWDFGGSWLRSRAAASDAAGAVDDQRASKSDVAFAVREAFFEAQAAQGLAQIANDAVVNQQKHVDQVEELVKVGLRSPIDAAQVKTNLANAQAQAASSAASYYAARVELGRVTGVSGAPEPAGSSLGVVAGEGEAESTVVAQALAARPEIAAEDKAVQSKRQQLDATRTEYLPTIDASVSANAATASLTQLDRFAPSASASINLTWNLFDGFGTMNDVRAAESAVAGEQATRAALDDQVRADVARALSDVKAARARLDALASAVDNARALQQLAQGRYEVGSGNIIELADADLAFVNASAQHVQADAQLSIARAALLHVEAADA